MRKLVSALLVIGLFGTILAPTAAASYALDISSLFEVVLDEDNNQLYYSTGPQGDSVIATDLAGNSAGAVTGLQGPKGMSLSEDGTSLFVALHSAHAVARIDLTTFTEVERFALGDSVCPVSLAVTAGMIIVGNSCATFGTGGLGVLDPVTGTWTTVTADGPFYGPSYQPYVTAAPGGRFAAGDLGLSPTTLFTYEISNGVVTALDSQRNTGGNLRDLAMSPEGTVVAQASGSPYAHNAYQVDTLDLVTAYTSTNYPNAVAWSGNGQYIATGTDSSYGDDVRVHGRGSPAAIANFELGANLVPRGLAISADGQTVYAISRNSDGDHKLHVLSVTDSSPCFGHPSTPFVATADDLDHAIDCYNQQQPAGPHTITLQADIAVSPSIRTITQADTSASLTVDGAGHTLSGPGDTLSLGEVDLFELTGAASLTITNLRVEGADRGAVFASLTSGALVISNSTFSQNARGIISFGQVLSMSDSVVSDNTISGVYFDGGSATLHNSGVVLNSVGVLMYGGSLTISESFIGANTNSGLFAPVGSAVVTSSTITNNGAGIESNGGSVAVSNTTITGDGTGIAVGEGSVTVASSIIGPGTGSACFGPVTNGGNNFASDTSCPGFSTLSDGSLGPLASYGCAAATPLGCVPGHPLLNGSNAINAGTCSGVVVGADPAGASNFMIGNLTDDQRGIGYPRTVGSDCDAGAFEADTTSAGYTVVAPSRIVDSRPQYPGQGTNTWTTPWNQGETRTVQVTGIGGVPTTNVTAVAIQVTSVGVTADSFLTAWAEGSMPLAASKNYGTTSSYAALTNDLLIVPVTNNGTIQIYNDKGTVDLVIDIAGYFATPPQGGAQRQQQFSAQARPAEPLPPNLADMSGERDEVDSTMTLSDARAALRPAE